MVTMIKKKKTSTLHNTIFVHSSFLPGDIFRGSNKRMKSRGSSNRSIAFSMLSVQLVRCSCRHMYCLQQSVFSAGGQKQTQVLSPAGCLYRWWAATDTSNVFSRLSVQLLNSCRPKGRLQQAAFTAFWQL